MTNSKRDSKGRILRNGEAQRKDGRYMFRYTDAEGTRRTLYSWRLVDTDKTPDNGRPCVALRDMEKEVLRDIDDGIKSHEAKRTTVNDLFDRFIKDRQDLRVSTRSNYICLYNAHIRNGLGRKSLSCAKPSDIRKLYMSLAVDKGMARRSIESINAILLQIFNNAVMDNVMRTNPAQGVLAAMKNVGGESRHRRALTEEEQAAFIEYVYRSDRYCRLAPLFTVLLGTGMRIGEALGLQWSSCDFKKNLITVDHTIAYKKNDEGVFGYIVSEPKTKAGNRTIPMLSDVRKVLLEERENRPPHSGNFSVGKYSDFIFLNSKGKVYSNSYIYDAIQSIVTDYNKEEAVSAKIEKRDPLFLPKISAHIFRHTFCTRLCENKTDIQDIKVIQDVMGHKNIGVTMDVYNDIFESRKTKSFQDIDGLIKLA